MFIIMMFAIVMIFNSDGKIMYISETASVHLGLSQVFMYRKGSTYI